MMTRYFAVLLVILILTPLAARADRVVRGRDFIAGGVTSVRKSVDAGMLSGGGCQARTYQSDANGNFINVPDGYPTSLKALRVIGDRTRTVYFCTPEAIEKLKEVAPEDVEKPNTFEQGVIWAINFQLTIVANVGIFLLWLLSQVLGPLLTL